MRSKVTVVALSVVILLGLSACNLFQEKSDTDTGSTQVNEVRVSDLDSDDGSAIESDSEADELINELETTLEDLENSLPEVSEDDFN
ncbi:MAG: hypothetical protein ACE5DX_02850 [Candidatus Dojkabacteria bacterium]